MEAFLKIIRIAAWFCIVETVVAAGINKSPFLLGVALAAMTYWYWRYPVFKKDESQED